MMRHLPLGGRLPSRAAHLFDESSAGCSVLGRRRRPSSPDAEGTHFSPPLLVQIAADTILARGAVMRARQFNKSARPAHGRSSI